MSSKIGLQPGYWFGTRLGKDLYKAVELTARCGADYIEFNPSNFLDLTNGERVALLNKCKELGLAATCNGGMMRSDAYLASPDKSIIERGLELCERVIEGCAQLEAPIWTGILHGIWGTAPEENTPEYIEAAYRRGIEGVTRVCEIAEKYKVTICLELVNRYEMFYLNTVEEGIRFCEEVNHPRCVLLLDTFHMLIEEDNMYEAIRLAQSKNLLGCIHAGESNRRIPTGAPSNIDWVRLGQIAKECGYNGPVSIEPFMFQSPAYSIKTCCWRNLADPDDLDGALNTASDGVNFLKKIFQ